MATVQAVSANAASNAATEVQTAAMQRAARVQEIADALSGLFRTTPPRQTLDAGTDAAGNPIIKTADGFTIKLTARNQDVEITSPEGYVTKIWGDPHVEENDGTKWDFKKNSTFVFGKNKITLKTTPYGSSNQTVIKSLSIYNDSQRISINDVDLNKPRLESYAYDAKRHDRSVADGIVYKLIAQGAKSFSWQRLSKK